MRHFDASTAGASMSAPGMDPRQWCSHGTVDPETEDQKSVTFTTAYGPLVAVTLHPSGIPVVCRVAHEVAGNGEGEWFPFVAGDEVQVVINEGSETAGCVIVGRLNQEIDQWPQKVAGQDATKNNFAFLRMRTPYIIETASSYLIRSATTGAFLGISQTGAVTIGNADKAFLALRPDFLGMQNADGDVLLQIDVSAKQVVIDAVGTKLVLDDAASSFLSNGTLQIGTSGAQPNEHATTIEAVARLFYSFLAAAGAAATTPITLAAFFATFVPPATGATFSTLLTAAGVLPTTPDLELLYKAIVAALSVPKSAAAPGLGAPGLMIG